MLNPIEKPTAEELRTAEIVFQSFSSGKRVIRAVVSSPQTNPPPGACVRPDFVFELHLHDDGSPATWWQVF
jgi:hypothetical protein